MVATTTCTCNNYYYKKNDDGWRPEPVKSPTNYYDQMVGNANIFIIDICGSADRISIILQIVGLIYLRAHLQQQCAGNKIIG